MRPNITQEQRDRYNALRKLRRREEATHDPAPQTSQRACLICDQDFRSEGPWHRICESCKSNRPQGPVDWCDL